VKGHVATLALLASLGVSANAGATTVRLLNLDELARKASHVVAGEVVAQEPLWMGRLLVTRVTLRVADCMKGACDGAQMTVHVLGGEVDGLAMMVEGSPRLVRGEQVVLFLQPAAGGIYRTVGMAQGKFALPTLDPDAVAYRDLSGLVLEQDGVLAHHRVDPIGDLRYSELKARVLAVRPVRSDPARFASVTP